MPVLALSQWTCTKLHGCEREQVQYLARKFEKSVVCDSSGVWVQHPAADVAAQAAAALAMMSKVAIQYGNTVDQRNANVTWAPKAERAYAYAKKMWQQHGDESSCTVSAANENCVGTGCTKLQDNGKPVLTVCFPSNCVVLVLA